MGFPWLNDSMDSAGPPVWLQEGRVAVMSPPCDVSIESSSRWCGALVRHPREQCNVHSIPIPIPFHTHLFPLKTSNQRNWGPHSVAKGSHGLDIGEIKLWGIARRNDSKILKNCTKRRHD
ncbi:hypothetical protein TNCV_1936531 [Trichonephila clavipes]|nr:hypothetical protein TNCV_1936531 [Trichonephila clavipes]